MSLIITDAFARLRECRAEYQLHLERQFAAADEHCVGYLLNERGRVAGVDAFSLFYGPFSRAYAYASEELLDYWARIDPRVTFEMFEYAWRDGWRG